MIHMALRWSAELGVSLFYRHAAPLGRKTHIDMISVKPKYVFDADDATEA